MYKTSPNNHRILYVILAALTGFIPIQFLMFDYLKIIQFIYFLFRKSSKTIHKSERQLRPVNITKKTFKTPKPSPDIVFIAS